MNAEPFCLSLEGPGGQHKPMKAVGAKMQCKLFKTPFKTQQHLGTLPFPKVGGGPAHYPDLAYRHAYSALIRILQILRLDYVALVQDVSSRKLHQPRFPTFAWHSQNTHVAQLPWPVMNKPSSSATFFCHTCMCLPLGFSFLLLLPTPSFPAWVVSGKLNSLISCLSEGRRHPRGMR